ncbi:hypothetical protein D5086_024766 [Populus alba]|uniref:Uncharacterized protein n=1 Tax=Populus alba TaxID=43335 RepID=A0ACC4B6E7_POPAL
MKEKRLTGDVATVGGRDGVVALLCSSEDERLKMMASPPTEFHSYAMMKKNGQLVRKGLEGWKKVRVLEKLGICNGYSGKGCLG